MLAGSCGGNHQGRLSRPTIGQRALPAPIQEASNVTPTAIKEVREVLVSFRDDIDRAENLRTTPEQKEAKAEAIEAALGCLLEALADQPVATEQ